MAFDENKITEMLMQLNSSVSRMEAKYDTKFDELTNTTNRLVKAIEGNGKAGLIDVVAQLRREFDVHTASEQVCPQVTAVKEEINRLSRRVDTVQDDVSEAKEENKTEKERGFASLLENKKFFRGLVVTVVFFILEQAVTIGWTVYSIAHNIK